MKRNEFVFVAVLLVSTMTACRTVQVSPDSMTATASSSPTHENLNAVLWVESSAEYQALTIGIFRSASRLLEDALADDTWTALPNLQKAFDLPPAVIVDVDETMLDNSYYEARLILDGGSYDPVTWKEWVFEANATAVPGALDFAQRADELGVKVFYVTNRRADEEEPTRRNLIALGFPVDSEEDTILSRGEREEWSMSDKTPRWKHVANSHRVLLMIGDNLGDFIGDARGSITERDQMIRNLDAMWGSKWLVIPNPTYGSWIDAILENERGLDHDEQLRRKWDALDPGR